MMETGAMDQGKQLASKVGVKAAIRGKRLKSVASTPSSPEFMRWQDDAYDRKKDQLLKEGYSEPNNRMRGRKRTCCIVE